MYSAIMGGIVYCIGLIKYNVLAVLLLQVLAGILVYIFISVVVKDPNFVIIRRIIKNKIANR